MNRPLQSSIKKIANPTENGFAVAVEGAIKSFKMYPPDHPACLHAAEKPHSILQLTLEESETVVINLIEGNLSINSVSTGYTVTSSILANAIKELGLKSIVVKRGVSINDLAAFLRFFSLKVSKSDEWGDLRKHIVTNGISHIEVDTLRYELVGSDEKVVSSDAIIASGEGGGPAGSLSNMVNIEFAKLVKDHPEFVIGLLADEDSARSTIPEEYRTTIDFNKVLDDVNEKVGTLSEDEIMRIVALGLKNRYPSDASTDIVDAQETLFDIKSMVEKVKNPNLVPKIKELVKGLNLLDDKYIDLILEGKYSKKKLVFEEMEKTLSNIESGKIDIDDVRLIPKRLEIFNDPDYASSLAERFFNDAVALEDGDTKTGESSNLLDTIVKSAVAENASLTCDVFAQRLREEFSDITIEMPRFGVLCKEAIELCSWLLDHGKLTELLETIKAIHRYISEEVVYAEGVGNAAEDFIFNFATNETTEKIIKLLKTDFEKTNRTVYELLVMLRSQASALVLCEYITFEDRSVRLMALRVLSEYGSVAINAFEMILSEMKFPQRSVSNPTLPQEIWYRVRNIIFVSGNIQTPEAIKIVERFASDPDPRIANEVIIALEKIGGERSCGLITGYLHFNDDNVKRRAAIALGNIGDSSNLRYLIETYNDQLEMRIQLASIIAKAGGEQAIDFLAQTLFKKESFIKEVLSKRTDAEKIAIVAALSRIKSQKSLAKLREFQKSLGSGFSGLFKSTTLAKAVNQAISRIEYELTTGQNNG